MFTAALVMLAACKGENTGLKDNNCNTIIYDYLYGVEYDDYDFDFAMQAFEKLKPAAAGCSEVRKGDFVGRNLDWYINLEASAIIKINASAERYASLGMVGSTSVFTNELAKSGEYSDAYKILPLGTVDGINEKGLYIGVNVMPTGETSFDEQSWEYGKWGKGAAFTNPESDKCFCVTYLVRVVLDNAASVSEAKDLVESINWYEPSGFPHEGESQAFHWLICDATTSAVLEFIDNVPYFTETTATDKPSYATVMTNFTNKLMSDAQKIQGHGMGYERWDTLVDNYEDAPDTFEGIEDLMKTVWYTKCYTEEMGSHNYMLTDFSSDKFPAYSLYKHYEYWDEEYLIQRMNHYKEVFADKENWHKADTPIWYTTHTSVYNLPTRELRVMTHEGYDEQQEFFSASFDINFAKPLDHENK